MAIAALFLLILVDAMGFAMVLPMFADYFGNSAESGIESSQSRNILYGVSVGIYPLLMAFGAPVLGALSDYWGRRRVLIVCSMGVLIGLLLIAVGMWLQMVALLLLGRAIGGATAASQAVALAALSDLAPPEKQNFYISMGLFFSSIGFVIGPAVTAFFEIMAPNPRLGDEITVLCVATIALIAFLLIVLRFPAREAARGGEDESPLKGLSYVWKEPILRNLSGVYFVQQLGWGAWFFFIPLYLVSTLGAPGSVSAAYMAVLGGGFCLTYGLVLPWLTDHFSARSLLNVTLAITTVLAILSAVFPLLWMQWAVALPLSVAGAAVYGVLILFFTRLSDPRFKGQVLGLTASLNALAFGITSLLGGFAEEVSTSGGVMLGAILLAVSLAAALFWTRSPGLERAENFNNPDTSQPNPERSTSP